MEPIHSLTKEQYEYLATRGYDRNFVTTYIIDKVENVILPINGKGGELIRKTSEALPLKSNSDFKVRLVVSQDLSRITRGFFNRILNKDRIYGDINIKAQLLDKNGNIVDTQHVAKMTKSRGKLRKITEEYVRGKIDNIIASYNSFDINKNLEDFELENANNNWKNVINEYISKNKIQETDNVSLKKINQSSTNNNKKEEAINDDRLKKEELIKDKNSNHEYVEQNDKMTNIRPLITNQIESVVNPSNKIQNSESKEEIENDIFFIEENKFYIDSLTIAECKYLIDNPDISRFPCIVRENFHSSSDPYVDINIEKKDRDFISEKVKSITDIEAFINNNNELLSSNYKDKMLSYISEFLKSAELLENRVNATFYNYLIPFIINKKLKEGSEEYNQKAMEIYDVLQKEFKFILYGIDYLNKEYKKILGKLGENEISEEPLNEFWTHLGIFKDMKIFLHGNEKLEPIEKVVTMARVATFPLARIINANMKYVPLFDSKQLKQKIEEKMSMSMLGRKEIQTDNSCKRDIIYMVDENSRKIIPGNDKNINLNNIKYNIKKYFLIDVSTPYTDSGLTYGDFNFILNVERDKNNNNNAVAIHVYCFANDYVAKEYGEELIRSLISRTDGYKSLPIKFNKEFDRHKEPNVKEFDMIYLATLAEKSLTENEQIEKSIDINSSIDDDIIYNYEDDCHATQISSGEWRLCGDDRLLNDNAQIVKLELSKLKNTSKNNNDAKTYQTTNNSQNQSTTKKKS